MKPIKPVIFSARSFHLQSEGYKYVVRCHLHPAAQPVLTMSMAMLLVAEPCLFCRRCLDRKICTVAAPGHS